MRIVCISDTHGHHGNIKVPDGDILVHAGDLSMKGTPSELNAFNDWLGSLPHRHKIVIAGNHDFLFERANALARKTLTHAVYLQDEGVEIDGLTIWGSPWQPWFFDWAFNLQRGEPLRRVWAKIPDDTDILVTHGPPHGVLDRTTRGQHAGCEELLARAKHLHRLRLHVFGHIHEASGVEMKPGYAGAAVNASICDAAYRVTNPPRVVELSAR